jgi:hypothetical protein
MDGILWLIFSVLARFTGAPTTADVEYIVSNYYFAFQIIQVFIVTTLSSAASSSVSVILKNPESVFGLLASRIPACANFYLSYSIVQGLGVVSGMLTSIRGLIMTPILSKLFDRSPRQLFNRRNSLPVIKYGTVFPVYANLLIIGKYT